MNSQLVDFENQEFDLNNLFNFNFGFEQLKFLLMSLIKSHKQTSQKVTNLEEILLDKEERIHELEKQTNNQDIFLSSKYKNFTSVKNEGPRSDSAKMEVINFKRNKL